MTAAPDDQFYMDIALEEARMASLEGEVPVGAVITLGNRILARAHNRPISLCDPSAHAEVLAIRKAAAITGNYRLVGASLYVTLEPCIMCCGAIIQARMKRLVFGARDTKGGGVVSLCRLLENEKLNHRVMYTEGVGAGACAEIISGFFRQKRIASPARLDNG